MSLPVINKIGGVFIHVKDLARAAKFYSDVMGLPEPALDPNSPIYCPEMEGPGLVLDDNRNNIGTERDVHPLCILKSADAGKTLAHMQEKGVEICFVQHHEEKVFLFTFRDTEGNVLMIMQEH